MKGEEKNLSSTTGEGKCPWHFDQEEENPETEKQSFKYNKAIKNDFP